MVDLARGSSMDTLDAIACPGGGVDGVEVEVLMSSRYPTILAMLPGFEERVMMVVTPADVAKRAATILVDIPPVPRLEPALDTALR